MARPGLRNLRIFCVNDKTGEETELIGMETVLPETVVLSDDGRLVDRESSDDQ